LAFVTKAKFGSFAVRSESLHVIQF